MKQQPLHRRVLMLSANPKGTDPLRLNEERREVEVGLMERSRLRDNFQLITKVAVRPRDFHRALLDYSPQIVHFSGHGGGAVGLALEDEMGNLQLVDAEALAELFKLFANRLDCVLLNACYSEIQAIAISQHIPYVIGMSDEIADRSAIEFAVAFYDALGAGKDVEFAYDSACVAIRLAGIAQSHIPVLHRKTNSDRLSQVFVTSSKATPQTTSMTAIESIPTSFNVFISYSHRDEELREELDLHLSNLKRQGKIKAWHDRAIEAGEEWEAAIKEQLETATIILLLISPRFMASDYCYDLEMERAIQRHEEGTARVIPIILKPVDWKNTPFSKLQVLPKDGQPITSSSWNDRDSAFLDVVQGIRRTVDALQKRETDPDKASKSFLKSDLSTPKVSSITSANKNQESEWLTIDARSGGNYFGGTVHINGDVVGRNQKKNKY